MMLEVFVSITRGAPNTLWWSLLCHHCHQCHLSIVSQQTNNYLNPTIFRENFAQDVDPAEANIMAVAQKPFNQSNFVAKSGPPAWKELPTWYQISESDHMIPPNVQHTFAEKMNATTLSLNASHASYVSHPSEIANFILNGTKGK